MQYSNTLWNNAHHSHHELDTKNKRFSVTNHEIPPLNIQPIIGINDNDSPSSSTNINTPQINDSTNTNTIFELPSPIIATPIVRLGNDIFKEPNEDPNEKDVISEIIPPQYINPNILSSSLLTSTSTSSFLTSTSSDGIIKKGGLYLTSYEMLKNIDNIQSIPNVRLIVQCAEEYTGTLQPLSSSASSTSIIHSPRTIVSTTVRGISDYDNTEKASIPSHPIIQLPSTIEVLELHMEDMVHFRIEPIITLCLPIIAKIRSQGGSVIINCAAGRSRSATIILYTLIDSISNGGEGMSLLDAIHLVRYKRPRACPNLGFITQLMNYETILKGNCTIPVSTLRYHFDAKLLFDTLKEAEEYGLSAIERGKEKYRLKMEPEQTNSQSSELQKKN